MTTQEILRQRQFNQQLSHHLFDNPTDVVAWMGAIQAQDYQGAKWAIGQRLTHTTDQSIENAFNEGKILRTHVMRPTWHFVAPADIRWMLKLTAPQVKRAMQSYNLKLALTEKVFKKAENIIIGQLQGKKQLTRQELKAALTRNNIKTNVQRLAHIVMQMELDAVICSGPLKGKQFTYMLLDERVSSAKSLDHEQSLAQLTKRYFQSHGPAQLQDFVWWSGLKTADAQKGINLNTVKLHSEVIDGKKYWFFPTHSVPIPNTMYLFPNYDEYGIAYKDRTAFFDPQRDSALQIPTISFAHLIVFKGQAIGLWRRIFKKDAIEIETKFFHTLSSDEKKAFQKACAYYSKFTGKKILVT